MNTILVFAFYRRKYTNDDDDDDCSTMLQNRKYQAQNYNSYQKPKSEWIPMVDV